jgi:hypothetical protein
MGNLSVDQVVASQDNKETTINDATAVLEDALTELFAKTLTSLTSPITLTTDEWLRAIRVDFTGALTGDFVAHAPAVKKLSIISNLTTGGFDVKVDIASGNGVTVHPGQQKLVYADGTNVVLVQDMSQLVGTFIPGLPGDGAQVLRFLAPFDFTIKKALAGARATAKTNPTATATFSLQKNDTQFGTIAIGTSGAVTLTNTADVTFTDDTDIFSIVAPSPQDVTLADVSLIVPIIRST